MKRTIITLLLIAVLFIVSVAAVVAQDEPSYYYADSAPIVFPGFGSVGGVTLGGTTGSSVFGG